MHLDKSIPYILIAFVIAVLLLAYKAPVDEGAVNAVLDSPFQLNLGETALVKSESLKIQFLEITEDSRCPRDVQCFWAGQATAVVGVVETNPNRVMRNVSLTLGGTQGAIKNIGGYSVELVALEPYPVSTKKIEPRDYSATFIVSKATATRTSCEKDSDCVPRQCCHPTEVVNRQYAPDCKGIFCTEVCLGPLDCGAGTISCISNECRIVLT